MNASKIEFKKRTMARHNSHVISISFLMVYHPMPAANTKKKPPITSNTMKRATATGSKSPNTSISQGRILKAKAEGGPDMVGIMVPGKTTMMSSGKATAADRKAEACNSVK